ncbi:glycosyltransferase family 2 protein [Planctomycetota bacterium]
MERVSVIIPVYNESENLKQCVESVLLSDYSNFEVLLVDDCSTDGSLACLDDFDDPRIRILRSDNRLGAAGCRNKGVLSTDAEFLFFTDADCQVTKSWIREGVISLRQDGVCGVEGPIYYSEPSPILRHKQPVNPFYPKANGMPVNTPGADYAGGNIAYTRQAFLAVNGFKEKRYRGGREDTDIGWRIRDLGEIVFNDNMRVEHKISLWTLRKLIISAIRYRKDVVFYKDHREFIYQKGRILHPEFLAVLLFPFLLFTRFRCKSTSDFLFLVPLYLYFGGLRLCIWYQALREGIFII